MKNPYGPQISQQTFTLSPNYRNQQRPFLPNAYHVNMNTIVPIGEVSLARPGGLMQQQQPHNSQRSAAYNMQRNNPTAESAGRITRLPDTIISNAYRQNR
ncbi:hypothetical protein Ciccas_014479 [Cichlidogyrus casuarinus]|uniref:Uncharacterized protein n=1 Tax=Cichlidogyrus casuarinus TaxID=1844966 RepID=A0ABD2PI69_9PLAT